jgi:hypothetical protein
VCPDRPPEVGAGAYGAPMWRYTLEDWDPQSGLTVREWGQQLADQHWGIWSGLGCWTTLDGRRVWRVSLRRWEEKGQPPRLRP